MFHVFKANANQAHLIHDLVHQIYYPTYKDILTKDQIDFMLEKSYTVTALTRAMSTDQDFYLLQDDGELFLGFMALKESSESVLRIEKLYLLPTSQGKGAGKFLISYAEAIANSKGRSILELNVNRGNKAYNFYLKQGFKVIQEIDIPYYGYVLDDYVMQKDINL